MVAGSAIEATLAIILLLKCQYVCPHCVDPLYLLTYVFMSFISLKILQSTITGGSHLNAYFCSA